jgi:hypothetical protein
MGIFLIEVEGQVVGEGSLAAGLPQFLPNGWPGMAGKNEQQPR